MNIKVSSYRGIFALCYYSVNTRFETLSGHFKFVNVEVPHLKCSGKIPPIILVIRSDDSKSFLAETCWLMFLNINCVDWPKHSFVSVVS